MNIEEYSAKDAHVTMIVWQTLGIPWYRRLWYRIRFGSNWMMKFR